jgi:2-dehydro-3-deoxyphosphogluconate aldolase / (4S)-4-hydroxy-2-oxoglutarate aldolase
VTDVLDRVQGVGVLPVIVLEDASFAVPLGDALKAGGLPIAEVTFRTAAAEEALHALAADPALLVGAGTVLDVDQVNRAVDAGARFIVSPGLRASVVRRAQELGVEVWPGVATPTEVLAALELGLGVVKLFPAGPLGGADLVKALAAPFPAVRFIPTGGVTHANLRDYLALASVVAVGGSWMVPPALLAQGDFTGISGLCAQAVAQAAPR